MKKCNYSNEIVNVVKEFLDEDDWKYSFDEVKGNFTCNLRLSGKMQKIRYVIDVKEDEMIVYGYSYINANPEDDKIMRQMAEFICRANYGIKNGNFEMDFYDGEIRYKSYVDCEKQIPSREVVKNSIFYVASMFETYGDGILDVIFKESSAKEAITKNEQTLDEKIARVTRQKENTDTEEMLSRYAQQLGITEEEIQDLTLPESEE